MSTCSFPYTVTLRAPALIAGSGRSGPHVETLRYIPGSSVRGIVAGAIGDPDCAKAERRERFTRHILSGSVRYLNAYPVMLSSGGFAYRSLPTPRSYAVLKHPESAPPTVYDLLCGVVPEPTERPDFDFAVLEHTGVHPVHVEVGSRVHHQRDRRVSHPTKESGALFTYQYICGEQAFSGYIVVDAESQEACRRIAEDIAACVGSRVFVGRSRRAGYGGDALFQVGLEPRETQIPGRLRGDIKSGQVFRILLLSDFVGRDTWTGQVGPQAFIPVLERELGKHLRVHAAHIGTGYAGGYNRKASMALPRFRTLAKGSVFSVEALENLGLDQITAVESRGVGLRGSEGYGEIVFLEAPSVRQLSIRHDDSRPMHGEASTEDGVSALMLSMMQRRILAQELVDAIRLVTPDVVGRGELSVSPSLIGRLRTPLRGSPGSSLEILSRWLSGTEQDALRTKALRQLKNCRLSQCSLYEWLDAQLRGEASDLLQSLRYEEIAAGYHLVSDIEAKRAMESMADEVKRALIDSVLAHVSRRVRAKERSGDGA